MRGLRTWVDSAPKIVVVLVLVLQQERDLERGEEGVGEGRETKKKSVIFG